jgi:branched-chain amino acid transport system substrate-binding protein
MEDELVASDRAAPALGRRIGRRSFLRVTAGGVAVVWMGGIVEACNIVGGGTGRAIKIGWVSPKTGPLAGFGEADDYIFQGVTRAFGAGLPVAGRTYPIQIISKDSQSDPNRAATVASELISNDGVDLMLVASTPETTNPVADQCEANGIPCISSVAPWQPYFFARQADPADPQPFQWTYHFFWGLEDIISVFLDMWSQVETNDVVGAIWPNDGDGNAWSDPNLGFPPAFSDAGFTLVDPGRYENLAADFSAQIGQFKSGDVQIVTGVPLPPDFTNFWNQAAQQDFRPRIASVGKALLFPASVEALGEDGDGLSTEVWWSPSHPFTSSLTGETAKQLADGYTTFANKQWTQPVGFAHALFEVAADVLKRTTNVDDKAAIRDAIKATKLSTIVGTVDWTTGQPFPNIAKTPLVGGQWGPGDRFDYDLTIVSNTDHPEIPKAGSLRPIPGST